MPVVKGRSRGVGVDILWVDVRERKKEDEEENKTQVHLEGGDGGWRDIMM